MHFDQNIVFFVIILIVGISRLIGRILENAREQSGRTKRPPISAEPGSRARVAGSKPKTDEERIREFLEALGQPAGTVPPPKVQPRTDLPPRPVAPVSPPPIARPFSPVVVKPIRQKRLRVPPPTVTTTAQSFSPATATNEPGTWITQEEKIEAAAAKFRAATQTLDEKTPSTASPAMANWRTLLQSAESVRTAIVVREVLGPPRGLRPLESPM